MRGDRSEEAAAGTGFESVWRKWMIDFGAHVRRVREFLGMSQMELARRAGVSQGAVSRFEGGRGLNTPFLVILRISMVLARALRDLDPTGLTEDVRRFLRQMEFFAPPAPGGAGPAEIRLTPDPEVEEVVRCYRRLSDPARRALAAALRTLAQRAAS